METFTALLLGFTLGLVIGVVIDQTIVALSNWLTTR